MTDHDLSRTPPALLRRARLRFGLVAVAVPVVLTVVGVAIIVAWMPELPDPVVTHWGSTGADGFGPASTYLWIMIGVGLALPILLAVATLAAVGTHWGGAARLMGAVAAGMSGFALVLNVGSLALQRGLADATLTPGIGGVMLLGFTALVVVGAAAWAVQPRVAAVPGQSLEPAAAVKVAAGERVVWVGTTTMPRAVVIIMGAVLLAVVVLSAFLAAVGSPGGWVSVAVLIIAAFALPATAAFRVRITPEGFAARSLIGWPRTKIPLSQIESARAVEISPFGEFGGWGWRIAVDGRTGIVMRRGSAIEVARRDGRPFIVTIDGAEEAASLLQAYVTGRTSISEEGR